MTTETAEIIFDELEELQKSIAALSVSTILTDTIAVELLQKTIQSNGQSSEFITEIKKYPIWIQRNEFTWYIDNSIREVALKKLNGSTEKFKQTAVKILKENQDFFTEKPSYIYKDYEFQLARISLQVESEQENAIEKLRYNFEVSEELGNHETARVFSSYIDESKLITKSQNNYPKYLLKAFYVRGYYAYNNRDYETALQYLLPVWKQYDKDDEKSMKDAGFASHFIGIIYIEQSEFKKAKKALQESIKIREVISDIHGKAMVLHTLGNLYCKTDRTADAENNYTESLRLLKGIDDQFGLAKVYNSYGNLLLQNNRLSEAEGYFNDSIKFVKNLEEEFHTDEQELHLAKAYHSLGNLYRNNKYFNKAVEFYLESLKIDSYYNNRKGIDIIIESLKNISKNDYITSSINKVKDKIDNNYTKTKLENL